MQRNSRFSYVRFINVPVLTNPGCFEMRENKRPPPKISKNPVSNAKRMYCMYMQCIHCMYCMYTLHVLQRCMYTACTACTACIHCMYCMYTLHVLHCMHVHCMYCMYTLHVCMFHSEMAASARSHLDSNDVRSASSNNKYTNKGIRQSTFYFSFSIYLMEFTCTSFYHIDLESTCLLVVHFLLCICIAFTNFPTVTFASSCSL